MNARLQWENPEDRAQVSGLIRGGKVVVGTSDTVIGLLAQCTQEGFEALNYIKGRQNKPYLIVIGNKTDLNYYMSGSIDTGLQSIIDRFWPGPLTIVVEAKASIPDYMKSSDGMIAIRMPHHPGILAMLQSFPGLFSTSANLSGKPFVHELPDVDPVIKERVAAQIDDSFIDKSIVPSTIVSYRDGKLTMLRQGAITLEELAAVSPDSINY